MKNKLKFVDDNTLPLERIDDISINGNNGEHSLIKDV